RGRHRDAVAPTAQVAGGVTDRGVALDHQLDAERLLVAPIREIADVVLDHVARRKTASAAAGERRAGEQRASEHERAERELHPASSSASVPASASITTRAPSTSGWLSSRCPAGTPATTGTPSPASRSCSTCSTVTPSGPGAASVKGPSATPRSCDSHP